MQTYPFLWLTFGIWHLMDCRSGSRDRPAWKSLHCERHKRLTTIQGRYLIPMHGESQKKKKKEEEVWIGMCVFPAQLSLRQGKMSTLHVKTFDSLGDQMIDCISFVYSQQHYIHYLNSVTWWGCSLSASCDSTKMALGFLDCILYKSINK